MTKDQGEVIYFNPKEKASESNAQSFSDISNEILKYQKEHNLDNQFNLKELTKKFNSEDFSKRARNYFAGAADTQEKYLLGSLLYNAAEKSTNEEIREFMTELPRNLVQLSSDNKKEKVKEYLSVLNEIFQDSETGETRNTDVETEDKVEILIKAVKKSPKYKNETGWAARYIEDLLIAERTPCPEEFNDFYDENEMPQKRKEVFEKLDSYQKQNNLKEELSHNVNDIILAYTSGIKKINPRKKSAQQYITEFQTSLDSVLNKINDIETINEAAKAVMNMVVVGGAPLAKEERVYEDLNKAVSGLAENIKVIGMRGSKTEEAKIQELDNLIIETMGEKQAKKRGIIGKKSKNHQKEDLNYNLKYFKLLNNILNSEENKNVEARNRINLVYDLIEKTWIYDNNFEKIEALAKKGLEYQHSF